MAEESNQSSRRKLTFSQAEGLEPLPEALQIKVISKELRAKIWAKVYESMLKDRHSIEYRGYYLGGKWYNILRDHFRDVRHGFVDDFKSDFDGCVAFARAVIESESYNRVFDFLTYILRHNNCPVSFSAEVSLALRSSGAAYRILDGDTVIPISNETELAAIEEGLSQARSARLQGTQQHLRQSAEFLAAGKYSDSIREAIHAVESVARSIDKSGSKTLGKALIALDKSHTINPQMKVAFEKLYAYTNTVEGLRHPMLEKGQVAVDETDARFMLGTCAAFVSYLIARGVASGMLKN